MQQSVYDPSVFFVRDTVHTPSGPRSETVQIICHACRLCSSASVVVAMTIRATVDRSARPRRGGEACFDSVSISYNNISVYH